MSKRSLRGRKDCLAAPLRWRCAAIVGGMLGAAKLGHFGRHHFENHLTVTSAKKIAKDYAASLAETYPRASVRLRSSMVVSPSALTDV